MNTNGSEHESEDELEADYVFMQEFREKRIQEMTKNLPIPGKPAENPVSVQLRRPEFGYCIDAGGEGWFLKEVNEEDPQVTVVVHIYEPNIRACATLNKHLEDIAASWVHVKFVRLMSCMSGVQVNPRALPIISIYRAGEQVTVIKNIPQDYMTDPGSVSREDVEWMLESSDGWTT
mmetsp:Transcript_6140/g.9259  ORF Transcript_6140/g.9259 Transcript_6140/m.9259 type:complete len:176 (+) Transcript_6140:54-581(+)